MKNTPSALKWLAEQRGRLAHDLAATKTIAEDVQRRLGKLQADLEAMDRAIVLFDDRIDPSAIEPVHGWKGRYGARGALKAAVESIFRAHSAKAPGEWLSTDTIELLVLLELNLVFETPAERKRWYANSFTKLLREMAAAGLVEREHDASVHTSEVGGWRLVRA